MEEIKLKYYKVRSLPSITKPNSVYYVKDENEDSVTSYITGKDCVPHPLIDATSFSAATEWSANHSTETGNPYTIGTHVFWNGHIYRCKFTNDGIPTTDSTYWLDLGVGYLLSEEQSDFDATSGRAFIRNKPTKTSDFINDGEDGANPFITLEDVPTFDPLDYNLDDFTNTGLNPFAKISDIPTYSDFIQDSITNGVVNKAPTENAVYDALQLKQNTIGYIPVNKSGDTMLGNLILNQDPTTALQAATKQYVDTIALGINFHAPVRVATTGNIDALYDNGIGGVGASLTGVFLSSDPLEIDTITLEPGDRVLVWQQTEEFQNGIYQVSDVGNAIDPFILTRTSDADNSPVGEIVAGDYVLALTGYNNGGYGFICNTPGAIAIGTTGIAFVQFNAAQAVTAGYGLREIVSNVISINPDETQEKITLTTTGSSGAATFVDNTLNIPQYSGLQNLQQVTDEGAITDNGITINPVGEDAIIINVNSGSSAIVVNTPAESSNIYPLLFSNEYLPYFLVDNSGNLTTVGQLEAQLFVKTGGLATEYLMADGSTTTGTPGGGVTNLGYTPSPTNGTVTSDTGDDAVIPLANATNAGLLKPAKFTVLENTSGSNSGDETTATIKTKLGITTLSGNNTGDQDLSNLVEKNTPITGATKTKITYDSKGLVTAGENLVASDIPNIAQSQVTNLTTDLSNKIAKNVATTYTTNTITTVTAAEYAAIGTKDANTLYFII